MQKAEYEHLSQSLVAIEKRIKNLREIIKQKSRIISRQETTIAQLKLKIEVLENMIRMS